MKYPLISIKSIIDDYIFSTGNDSINPDEILYHTNKMLGKLVPGEQFRHDISLIPVHNYVAELPSNFKWMLQASYLDSSKKHPIRSEHVVEYAKHIYGTDCDITAKIECDKCSDHDYCKGERIILDVDHNWLTSNPQHTYNHMNHYYGHSSLGNVNHSSHHSHHHSSLHDQFELMRRTSNYFFNIPYHVNECININADSMIEYDINPPYINVNFKEGQILIAYLGVPVDEDGYLLIPNNELVIDALIQGIEERLAYIAYRAEKTQTNRIFWQQALELSAKSNKKAIMRLQTPDPDEWEIFIRNHWIKRVPHYKYEATHNRYVGDRKHTQF